MHTTTADVQSGILEALAHPNRIRIVEMLRQGPRCNCEIAPELGLEQSNLSRHLKILVQAGILHSWKDGLRVIFKVADSRIFKLLDLVTVLARHDVQKRLETLQITSTNRN
ncbi:MAG: winged helix-turn-helix transcriptional regulator [Bacteroidetes bacterium]|nr:winged helix-turn-helix transcriptional regulator [Bacteroidota bacterium]